MHHLHLRSVMLTINMIIVVTHQWEKCCASKALNKLHFPLFIQCNRWHKDGRTNQPFWHVYKAFKSWNGLLQRWKYLANAFYAQHILLEEAGFNLHLLETPLTRKDCMSDTFSNKHSNLHCCIWSASHTTTQQRGGLRVRRNVQITVNHLTGCFKLNPQ